MFACFHGKVRLRHTHALQSRRVPQPPSPTTKCDRLAVLGAQKLLRLLALGGARRARHLRVLPSMVRHLSRDIALLFARQRIVLTGAFIVL